MVGSETGGIPEIVRPGETGFLTRPGDPEDLAEKIAMVLEDREAARAVARAGRELAEKDFNVNRMVEGTLAVYQDLLRKGARRPA